MSNSLPIKFSWGLFCRRAIIDKDTGELSAIDIIQALTVEQIDVITEILNPNTNIAISLGNLHAIAFFEREDDSIDEINELLNFELTQSGFSTSSFAGEITLKSSEPSTFINLKLGSLVLNGSMQIPEYTFTVGLKIRDCYLAKLVLPVKVKFKLLGQEL